MEPVIRPHVSFSEISTWVSCPFKHKLKYIDKVDFDQENPGLIFGTSLHAWAENYLNTKQTEPKIFEDKLKELWEGCKGIPSFQQENIDEFLASGREIIEELPEFFEKQFPNWVHISAEEEIYCKIDETKETNFKGFLDASIAVEQTVRKKQVERIFILDWKTTKKNWTPYKRRDFTTKMQLALYKNFWGKKHEIDPDIIRAGFILLKRQAKKGKKIEFVDVSLGPKTIKKSLVVIDNMIANLGKGFTPKNRSSCEYCEYFATEFCTQK
jgi:hypothetical protein